jgi:cysteine desulfurase
MAKNHIYLDYNATTATYPEVSVKMQEILAFPANPSSVHYYGREAKKHLENARKTIADAVSAWPNEIIFMGSGTEANNTALRCVAPERQLLVSAIEHSSVMKARNDALILPVDSNGALKLDALEAALINADAQLALVSIMLANNETGVIQPVAEASAICKKYGALLHCDAVQGLGKIPVDFGALGVDMMTISAHKCGGPTGAAALVIRRDLPLKPILTGGGQELGRRAGTENLAAIAGFAVAVEKSASTSHMASLRTWLNNLENTVEKHGGTVFGKGVARLPNTSCITMPSASNELQLMDFDLKGFCVSAGSACSSGRIEVSHVLAAMGAEKSLAASAIRVSAGWATKEDEIQAFAKAWESSCERLAKSSKSA